MLTQSTCQDTAKRVATTTATALVLISTIALAIWGSMEVVKTPRSPSPLMFFSTDDPATVMRKAGLIELMIFAAFVLTALVNTALTKAFKMRNLLNETADDDPMLALLGINVVINICLLFGGIFAQQDYYTKNSFLDLIFDLYLVAQGGLTLPSIILPISSLANGWVAPTEYQALGDGSDGAAAPCDARVMDPNQQQRACGTASAVTATA